MLKLTIRQGLPHCTLYKVTDISRMHAYNSTKKNKLGIKTISQAYNLYFMTVRDEVQLANNKRGLLVFRKMT